MGRFLELELMGSPSFISNLWLMYMIITEIQRLLKLRPPQKIFLIELA